MLNIDKILSSTRIFSFLVTIACFYYIYISLKTNHENKDDLFIAKIYSWIATAFLILIIFLELNSNHST